VSEAKSINVSSLVSNRTGEGRVHFDLDEKPFMQLGIDEARAFAHNVLAAAEAAETDALLLRWATKNEMPVELLHQMLNEIRALRFDRSKRTVM
jgi:hypothetical protein